mmetsp:Transcript_55685/g.120313  ORF Transcript_55685/g.120313 Transcript_55685/m.120313 type:complete len:922 (-) Transcript_55685:284-3049(-)
MSAAAPAAIVKEPATSTKIAGKRPATEPAPAPSPKQSKQAIAAPKPSAMDDADINGDGETLVITARGPDKVGVTSSFVAVIRKQGGEVKLLDLSQILIAGQLALTIVLLLPNKGSMGLMKELLEVGKEIGLEVQFTFPSAGNMAMVKRQVSCEDTGAYMADITVVTAGSISVALLCAVIDDIANHLCTLVEIRQRDDDKAEWNGEFTKLNIKAYCPPGTLISAIFLTLQEVCWAQGAEVSVREWDNMNYPNGKSLVVFGLSDVLLPYDVLDEMLKEAGVDPEKIEGAQAKSPAKVAAAKVKALTGKKADCIDRVLAKLRFTQGAHFLCRSLKEMGFRLGLLTNTGCLAIANAVKKELGLDYALSRHMEVGEDGCFTGRFGGESSEIQFRKKDCVQLMAEKEGIEMRNVTVVGGFMSGLSRTAVSEVLDTFGPLIYFHARRPKPSWSANSTPTSLGRPPVHSLRVVLYLLGLGGRDIRQLKTMFDARDSIERIGIRVEDDAPKLTPRPEDVDQKKPMSRFLVRARSEGVCTENLAAALKTMLPHAKAGRCALRTIKMSTLISGGSVMGLELCLSGEGAERQAPLKDLLFEAQSKGLTMDYEEQAKPHYDEDGDHERGIIILVQTPNLDFEALSAIFKHCSDLSVNCLRLERLSSAANFSALQVLVSYPPAARTELRNRLLAASKVHEVDIAFQIDGIQRWGHRLIVFDMDSTLIQQEVIDELARLAGVEKEVSEITERAMSGELDFFESLRERVAYLKGHKASELFAKVKEGLVYTPGAHELCKTLKRLGYKMAVISGGFLPVAREVQRSLSLDYAFANNLEVDAEGMLTGRTVGPVVTPQRKRALLSMIAEVEGCGIRQTVAVGDGSNDIPMLCHAGLGVAFCAKAKVQAIAQFRVNTKDLSTVLFLVGLSEAATVRLLKQ